MPELTPNFSIPIPSDPLSQLDARRAWMAVDGIPLSIFSLSSPTSITIIADNDANGSGTIDLKTRNLTRLQVTNAGDVNVVNQLGINTPNPLVPIDITVTYLPDITASQDMIRFNTPTVSAEMPGGHHPFRFNQRTTTFGDDRTDSVGWGFQPIGGGAPSMEWLMEDTFGTPDPQFELHIQTDTTGGGSDRPFTFNVDRATGRSRWTTSCAEILLKGGALGVSADTTAPSILFHEDTGILINVPLDTSTLRIQAEEIEFQSLSGGSATTMRIMPLPTDAGLGWLVFGDATAAANGLSMAKSDAVSMKLYSGGSDLDPGVWRAKAFYAYGSTWGTHPLMKMDADLRIASGTPIYFSSTSNPDDVDVQLVRSGAATLSLGNFNTGFAATLIGIFDITTGAMGGAYKANGVALTSATGKLLPAQIDGYPADATKFLNGNGGWTVPAGGGDALVASPLSQFAATTSAQLAGVISNETGSGALVFATSPGFTTAANPISNDGATLGTAALQWSDLFLAEGGVINWDNGDLTLTQTGDVLVLAGGSLGIGMSPDNPLSIASTSANLQDFYRSGVLIGTISASNNDLNIVASTENMRFVVPGGKFYSFANGNVGIGTSAFGTSAVGVLGIGNGTEPSTSPADMIQLYSVDLSAGNATLGLRTETAVVTEAVTSDRSLSIRVNGVTYKVLLKS